MVELPYDEQKAVARAHRAFYAAFEALDMSAMSAVWLPDDRIKCIHPGWELLVGLESVMRSWEVIFQNTESIRFELSDLRLDGVGDGAWSTVIEDIETVVSGRKLSAQAVTTHLYVPYEGEYRLALHHASPVTMKGFEE